MAQTGLTCGKKVNIIFVLHNKLHKVFSLQNYIKIIYDMEANALHNQCNTAWFIKTIYKKFSMQTYVYQLSVVN